MKTALQALANQGLTPRQIKSTASRIAEMSVEEIGMQLFRRMRPEPTPVAEASRDLVGLVAQLRTASRRRTNAEVLALIADELEDEGLIKSARHVQHVGRETVSRWLARILQLVTEDQMRRCLEKLLDAYKSGVRLRRVK